MNGIIKKIFGWQFCLGIVLILISAALYYVHFLVFKDAGHIVLYLLGDIAFVPIEVLIVTLIIHKLLTVREKKALLQKMNMLIGAFFSEVGTELLERFSGFDPGIKEIRNGLMMSSEWPDKKFAEVSREMKALVFKADSRKGDLGGLKSFLVSRRQFMLGLLENPVLLEHDSFTDLLWAVFHITEELDNRKDPAKLPEADYSHLSGDINRAYKLIVSEWLDYMLHLKKAYPYLFSLAVRTNPFNPEATAEVS